MSIDKQRIEGVSRVLRDPGVLFSGLHAIIFSESSSSLIEGLGYASLALTTAVSSLRNVFPKTNELLTAKFSKVSERLNLPQMDAIGFPLFLNGLVLGGIALASFAKGDYQSGSISLAYAIANTDKGARISGNTLWTLENLCQKAFSKVGLNNWAENPPTIIKHGLYLPELWGSAGAFIYALSHSGWGAGVGLAAASFGIVAAAVNNGSADKPRLTQYLPESFRLSDQVVSRGSMAVASFNYAVGAISNGNILPAVGHGMAALANGILTKQDRQRQLSQLNPSS